MAAKCNKLTHKIAIQLQLVAENCTICCSRSRRRVRKLLDTPSYMANAHLYVYGSKTHTRSKKKFKLLASNLLWSFPTHKIGWDGWGMWYA